MFPIRTVLKNSQTKIRETGKEEASGVDPVIVKRDVSCASEIVAILRIGVSEV